MSPTPRRTQRERREATIAKLLEATIECLIEEGYRDTSIARICKRAKVSHGGLFRHFPSRTALIAAATDEIVRRHMANLRALIDEGELNINRVEAIVLFFREGARAPLTAAWREVLVAARTNSELSDAVTPAVRNFEDAIMDLAAELPGASDNHRELGTLLLSLMHLYDSEATTIPFFATEDIEVYRFDWAVKLLSEALGLTD